MKSDDQIHDYLLKASEHDMFEIHVSGNRC